MKPKHPALVETLDFAAHAGSAFLVLVAAFALGVYFTPEGAVFLAWTFGLVREFTEWQDGGKPPWTFWGILDQVGWIVGGVAFVWVLDL
jgi:uncharacterized membrane protein YphA (DoxX/SURF4 family)